MIREKETVHSILFFGHKRPLVSQSDISDLLWVGSPIDCLNVGTQHEFKLIIISFHHLSLAEWADIVELCKALKSNAHTKSIPVLALLPYPHRRLMGQLDGVTDFVRIVLPELLQCDDELSRMIRYLNDEDVTKCRRFKICPHLNYIAISERHEMTVCGGYKNRMVIGRRRLEDFCHTHEHENCPYFLNLKL